MSANLPDKNLVDKCINTIRCLSIDGVERADSGHPGAPMGLAPAGYLIWRHHLRHNPADPEWPNRDRFVLSNGHASMLLYSLLYLTGYNDMTIEQLKNFRQWGSRTAGHPEHELAGGIETTTGPLGQGFANGVGMGLAEAHLNQKYDGVIDHYTYVFCSDGDLMEGIASEAASLAGHLGLGKLIYVFDNNHITIDGSTDLAFTEDVLDRFDAYGWHTQRVDSETDLRGLDGAIDEAKSELSRPSIISLKTTIGYGSPNKSGTAGAHGSPLGPEEVERTKRQLGWEPDEPFYVPDEVLEHMRQVKEEGQKRQADWKNRLEDYGNNQPDKHRELVRRLDGELPENWDRDLPSFEPSESGMATRDASGDVLEVLYDRMPELFGGSADLSGSNRTLHEQFGIVSPGEYNGQNIHFGVREHAMCGITNGINLHGGLRGYCATFLIFSDYMRPSIRLSALMEQPTILVLTHDSIGLGEDGPTHQPIEHLASLRAMPNCRVFRPADANEVVDCWRMAIEYKNGPSALALTRQSVPTLDLSKWTQIGDATRGGYVVADADSQDPDAILMATGSELAPCLEARADLADRQIDVRVVSLPCWDVFDQQPQTYREKIIPPNTRERVAVEAASPVGWKKYVGDEGGIIGIDRFGASAPADINFEKYGFTAADIAQKVESVIS